MLKADPEPECIRRWRHPPRELGSNRGQAASFARVRMDKFEYDTSGDRYRHYRVATTRSALARRAVEWRIRTMC